MYQKVRLAAEFSNCITQEFNKNVYDNRAVPVTLFISLLLASICYILIRGISLACLETAIRCKIILFCFFFDVLTMKLRK
jgi:hypothetical protein